MKKLTKKELEELKRLSKEKRLTREEWERLAELEGLEKEIIEEIIEQECEKLAETIHPKHRLTMARDLFKKKNEKTNHYKSKRT